MKSNVQLKKFLLAPILQSPTTTHVSNWQTIYAACKNRRGDFYALERRCLTGILLTALQQAPNKSETDGSKLIYCALYFTFLPSSTDCRFASG